LTFGLQSVVNIGNAKIEHHELLILIESRTELGNFALSQYCDQIIVCMIVSNFVHHSNGVKEHQIFINTYSNQGT
jgi:hypothetical protein